MKAWIPPLIIAVMLFTACRREESAIHRRTSNEVAIRLEAEPDRLNPLLSTSTYAHQVFNPLHLYLMNYDPTTLVLVPQLLEESPRVQRLQSGPFAGGTRYSFTIRKEAVWDNGKPVTGRDYETTLKLVFNAFLPTLGYRTFLESIREFRLDAANPRKFSMVLNDTYFAGLEALTNVVPVLPRHVVDASGVMDTIPLMALITNPTPEAQEAAFPGLKEFADKYLSERFSRDPVGVAGVGPYRLVSWEAGQEILLEKKTTWWGNALAADNPAFVALPDRLRFKVIPDPVTALTALQNEELDVMQSVAPDDFVRLRTDSLTQAHFAMYTPSSMSSYFIALNTRIPVLSDALVRRALAHAVDVDELITTVFAGFGTRTATPLHPSSAEYNAALKPIPFSLEKAGVLLAQAGWQDSDGNGILDKRIAGKKKELRITYLANASKQSSLVLAELIRSNARKVGVDVVIEARDANTMLERLRNRDFEMVSAGRSITPQWSPSQNWRTDSDNRSGFGDAQTDSMIDAMEREPNQSRRWVISRKLQQAIYDQQPEIMLFCPQERLLIHKRFEAVPTPVWPGYHPLAFRLIKR